MKTMRRYRASEAGCKQLRSLFLMSRNYLLANIPASPLFSGDCLFAHYPCNTKRFFSKSTYQWISRFRFGTDAGIFFGAPIDASDEDAQITRKLYCRALIFASGGSTMARDWIAGCSALLTSEDEPLSIALQYMAGADDVANFRAHILKRLLLEDEKEDTASAGSASCCSGEESSVSQTGEDSGALLVQSKSVYADPVASSSREAEVSNGLSKEQIRKLENYVLQDSPIVRCFLYDAMTASLFKRRGETSILEETRRRAFDLNAQYFGVSIEDLTAIWHLVEAEFILKEEKTYVLGQPWGD